MNERVTFRFPEPDHQGSEADIGLAIFTAECIHGRPQTRLETGYWLTSDGSRAVFESRGPAGECALRVLVGLLGARFGEFGFEVRKPTEEVGA